MSKHTAKAYETQGEIFRHDCGALQGRGMRPVVIASSRTANFREESVQVVAHASGASRSDLTVSSTPEEAKGTLYFNPLNVRILPKEPIFGPDGRLLMEGLCLDPSRPHASGTGWTAGHLGAAGQEMSDLLTRINATVTGADLSHYLGRSSTQKERAWRDVCQWSVIKVTNLLKRRLAGYYLVLSHDRIHRDCPLMVLQVAWMRPVPARKQLGWTVAIDSQMYRVTLQLRSLSATTRPNPRGSVQKVHDIELLEVNIPTTDRDAVRSEVLGRFTLDDVSHAPSIKQDLDSTEQSDSAAVAVRKVLGSHQ